MPFSLYVAAAVFGLLFVGWGAIAGGDAEPQGGVDHDAGVWALFSLRSLAFGALTFGAVGALGSVGGWSRGLTALLAFVLGAGVWVGVGALFRYLRVSESGTMLADASWIGTEAELVVPFDASGVGRIALLIGGQLTEIAARRAPAFATVPAEAFRRCQVEQLEGDVALVMPLARQLVS
jgi:hypothetical protein